MDIKKYSITQEELDAFICTLSVPRPVINIVENSVMMGAIELYKFTKIENVDLDETALFQQKLIIDKLCIEHFSDMLILPIDQNALATKGDVEELNEMIMENLINTEYLTCLTELGL